MARKTLTDHAGRIDPVLSMGTRIYDLAARWWPQATSAFVAGGGMTMLAYFTASVRALGPLFIGSAGLLAGLICLIAFASFQLLRAKRARTYAETANLKRWGEQVDHFNPLDLEFRKFRMNISDIRHPVTKTIANKRFIDCELFGPATIAIFGSNLNQIKFNDCDFILAKENVLMRNVFVIMNCEMINCALWDCVIFVGKSDLQEFKTMGAHFVSITNDAELDAQLRPPPKRTG